MAFTPATHQCLLNTHLTQQHTPYLAINASLSSTHLTLQHTPHSATHASISNTRLIQQHTPHSATHASLSNTCLHQQHTPHSATHASLSNTHLTQQHTPHSAKHASLSNTHLTQQHTPHSVSHPHSPWPSPLIHTKVCSTHTSLSQARLSAFSSIHPVALAYLTMPACVTGVLFTGAHVRCCTSFCATNFLNPPQCDTSLPFWLCLLHVLDAQELFPPNFAVQKG